MTDPKIFLCYAHEEIGIAKKFYNDLKKYNLDVWFDIESILPEQSWEEEVKKAILECDFFIVLLASNYVSRKNIVPLELKFCLEVLDQLTPDEKKYLIPVCLDNCDPIEISSRFKGMQCYDFFPENEYENGMRQILKLTNPGSIVLRNIPHYLTEGDVSTLIKKYDFYDIFKNPNGKSHSSQFTKEIFNREEVIIDEITNLMWQQSGSTNRMGYERAEMWIDRLNKKGYAGHHDWRLPTIEEAMVLMEPRKLNGDLSISSLFSKDQPWIWSADLIKNEKRGWVIIFDFGGCDCTYLDDKNYVRAVRSGID